jgi:hypothetical protein
MSGRRNESNSPPGVLMPSIGRTSWASGSLPGTSGTNAMSRFDEPTSSASQLPSADTSGLSAMTPGLAKPGTSETAPNGSAVEARRATKRCRP